MSVDGERVAQIVMCSGAVLLEHLTLATSDNDSIFKSDTCEIS